MAYATGTELNNLVGHDLDSTRADFLLERASAACDTAVRTLGVTLTEVAGDQQTLDGNGAEELLLPGWPVTGVSEVKIIKADGTEDVLRGPADDSPEYRWSRTGILTRVGACWPSRPRSVVVTFTHGFAAADLPDELKTITLEVAAIAAINPQQLRSLATDGTTPNFGAGGLRLSDEQTQRLIRAVA